MAPRRPSVPQNCLPRVSLQPLWRVQGHVPVSVSCSCSKASSLRQHLLAAPAASAQGSESGAGLLLQPRAGVGLQATLQGSCLSPRQARHLLRAPSSAAQSSPVSCSGGSAKPDSPSWRGHPGVCSYEELTCSLGWLPRGAESHQYHLSVSAWPLRIRASFTVRRPSVCELSEGGALVYWAHPRGASCRGGDAGRWPCCPRLPCAATPSFLACTPSLAFIPQVHYTHQVSWPTPVATWQPPFPTPVFLHNRTWFYPGPSPRA